MPAAKNISLPWSMHVCSSVLVIWPGPFLQVARRVRIEAPASQLFSVRRLPRSAARRCSSGGGNGRGTSAACTRSAGAAQGVGIDASKVAAGMEAAFAITFKPDSLAGAACELVVVTEREKFLVPLLARGAAPALDVPDSFTFATTPAKRPARQTLLVRNVGSAAGEFTFAAHGPFGVEPHDARLAPSEALQLNLSFQPPGAGEYAGELQVAYEDGRVSYTALAGVGSDLPVGLSASELSFLPTFVGKLSQRSFRVVNGGAVPLAWAVVGTPSAHEAAAAAGSTTLTPLRLQAALGGPLPPPNVGCNLSTEASVASTTVSAAEREADALLADARLAAQSRSGTRSVVPGKLSGAAAALWASPHFSAFPPQGEVWPGCEAEVIVQFAPDAAGEFEETAWVELQGRGERQPLRLCGQGLGPAACFTCESLDIGHAFVSTRHEYVVELQNRYVWV